MTRSRIRSMASYVEPSAVTYAARATLTRGKSVPTSPVVWVPGADPPFDHVQKWVINSAVDGDMAHVIDGYLHSGRQDQLLEHIPLDAYRGVRPTWWPDGNDMWESSPNNTHDTEFWASVCTSACIRDHLDTVNVVLVDLLSSDASCSCYAWEDTSGVDHNASHSAPSDVQLMDWMHGSIRIVDPLAAPSTHAKLATYAVHKRVGHAHYMETLQSTVYISRVYSNNIYFDLDVSPSMTANALYTPNNFEDCLYQCYKELSLRTRSIIWTPAYSGADGAPHTATCHCMDEDMAQSSYGHRWRNHRGDKPDYPVAYSTRLCTNVRASDERSIVYSKRTDGFCPGVPIYTGFTLTSHSLLTVAAAGADEHAVPFDVRCRKLCLDDAECGMAHLYASTFAYQCARSGRTFGPRPHILVFAHPHCGYRPLFAAI